MKNDLKFNFEQIFKLLSSEEEIELKRNEMKHLVNKIEEQIEKVKRGILMSEKQQLDLINMNENHEKRYQEVVQKLKQQYDSLII